MWEKYAKDLDQKGIIKGKYYLHKHYLHYYKKRGSIDLAKQWLVAKVARLKRGPLRQHQGRTTLGLPNMPPQRLARPQVRATNVRQP